MINIICNKCNHEFSIFEKVCPNCGDKVKISSKFYCGTCGKKIDIYKKKCSTCNKIPDEIIIKSKNGKEVRTSFDIEGEDNNNNNNNDDSIKDENINFIHYLLIVLFFLSIWLFFPIHLYFHYFFVLLIIILAICNNNKFLNTFWLLLIIGILNVLVVSGCQSDSMFGCSFDPSHISGILIFEYLFIYLIVYGIKCFTNNYK